ncbi:MAG TPA: hypothetical protein PKA41_05390 [Verrucomicrobiota bacterium]|nr:hypothetical protein [Verrucomicrobiota bacterium]
MKLGESIVKRSIRVSTWIVAIFACIIIFAVVVWFVQIFVAMHQDSIWKRKVRRQINLEETRAWALSVLKQADPYGPYKSQQDFLTNAPAYLLKQNYKRNPYIIVSFECVHLRYGGGMYDWGLTIGDTNLPAHVARSRNVEQWSPGIYFWNN